MQEISKTYNPHGMEDKIYEKWQKGGYFGAVADKSKTPFTIVIPPPNVTGKLHMGHALDETLQDILIRYKRMRGFNALWIPGTDHAGIATQIKVEEVLREKEGKTRYDLGREEFLKRVWEWKELYGGNIVNQLKKLGSSCDWSRERFTMDEGCSRAVKEVFVNLYEKGLIYKGFRIINWCPKCATALSDAEVEYSEHDGHLWYVKYPVKGSEEFVTVATTRPETMLGDSAVAVNPGDERYVHLVGKTLLLPLTDREIPVVADEYVDLEYGTGCVKITPCHDPNDFELGKRHGLQQILIFDDNARVNKNGGKYEGLDRYEARERILKDLTDLGLLVKTECLKHNVGSCYRCKTVVEPMTSSQWFVKMEPLAKPAIEAVKDGTIKFVPEMFSKTYINWMENVRDWCISRQLWWGHRIPAYYCECGETIVSKETPEKCHKCGSTHLKQEDDVLDTWFSSALWPFSTLGWPEKTADLEHFYPTSVLVTAYDIIFFWVARMIFSGLEHTGQAPFSTVFIHGIVRDAQGRKMSKSLGNGIDPLEIIEKYGADALRFTLATGNSPGNDMRFNEERIESSRNYANKLWNAARFALMNCKADSIHTPDSEFTEDRWAVSVFNTVAGEICDNLDKFEIGVAAAKIYDFIWDILCDWYIELIKPRLYESNTDEKSREAACNTLLWLLDCSLRLLHPFMPFITEEIWQSLPTDGESIMISDFPVYSESLSFPNETKAMERIMGTIKAIRNTRAEMNVPANKRTHLYIETPEPTIYENGEKFFQRLAGASEISVNTPCDTEKSVTVICDGAKVFIPLDELVDSEKEKARLTAECQRLEGELTRIDKMLGNQGFVSKAPAKLVEQEKAKREKYEQMLSDTKQSLGKYEDL